ncbi:hypothetical protein M885DRAFT_514983 [Pelagophyceae sp. CCMP2097]|nr:hypothetical protein M885DRAFT_514983 [Pelagophyceae sp. CCMP2097]
MIEAISEGRWLPPPLLRPPRGDGGGASLPQVSGLPPPLALCLFAAAVSRVCAYAEPWGAPPTCCDSGCCGRYAATGGGASKLSCDRMDGPPRLRLMETFFVRAANWYASTRWSSESLGAAAGATSCLSTRKEPPTAKGAARTGGAARTRGVTSGPSIMVEACGGGRRTSDLERGGVRHLKPRGAETAPCGIRPARPAARAPRGPYPLRPPARALSSPAARAGPILSGRPRGPYPRRRSPRGLTCRGR